MLHRIPGSPKTIGPRGQVFKGGRSHIGRKVMTLEDFLPRAPRVRRSRSSSSRSRSRRK